MTNTCEPAWWSGRRARREVQPLGAARLIAAKLSSGRRQIRSLRFVLSTWRLRLRLPVGFIRFHLVDSSRRLGSPAPITMASHVGSILMLPEPSSGDAGGGGSGRRRHHRGED